MRDGTKEFWREEQAKREVGVTDISRSASIFLTVCFLVMIGSVPVVQHVIGLRELIIEGKAHSLGFYAEFAGTGTAMTKAFREARTASQRLLAPNAALLRQINAFQKAMDDACFLTTLTVAPVQAALCRVGVGNEKVIVGRDGWLFYEPGVRYVTGAPFLDADQLRRRAAGGSEYAAPPQPDPVAAIVHFRDALAAHGVALVVMPVPVKPSVHPEKLSQRVSRSEAPVQNPSWDALLAALSKESIRVFDPAPVLTAMADDVYLKTDTHWRPEAMQRVATSLGGFLRSAGLTESPTDAATSQRAYTTSSSSVINFGDIAIMLKLPASQTIFSGEPVRHTAIGAPDEAALPAADVLLLGDSFANIYALEDMGWGAGGGLADQLAAVLGRPVERIVRNDSGAYATRQMLALELGRGRNRLDGIRCVVWEFATRELAVGDWKLIDLVLGDALQDDGAKLDAAAGGVRVQGRVGEVSDRPQAGAVYKDFVMKLHVTEMKADSGEMFGSGDGVVRVMAMRGRKILPIAAIKPGATITLRLQPWDEVRKRYESLKTGALEDMMLELDSALYWGATETGRSNTVRNRVKASGE